MNHLQAVEREVELSRAEKRVVEAAKVEMNDQRDGEKSI